MQSLVNLISLARLLIALPFSGRSIWIICQWKVGHSDRGMGGAGLYAPLSVDLSWVAGLCPLFPRIVSGSSFDSAWSDPIAGSDVFPGDWPIPFGRLRSLLATLELAPSNIRTNCNIGLPVGGRHARIRRLIR